MGIIAIGLSHHSCPVALRERFAFAEPELPAIMRRLRDKLGLLEVVILSTCNRVEIYAVTAGEDRATGERLIDFLLESRGGDRPEGDVFYLHSAPASMEHLFRVASGLDSMVLGETEILGQLKKAYQVALDEGHTGKLLNKVFQKAFNVAKHIRTKTMIQRGSISVGSVSVELAEKIFDTLKKRRVMVIGAGDTSEKTARFLMGRGAQHVYVTNRSLERAEALANELEGTAVPFDRWEDHITEIDIIISSTSAPHYVLNRARMEQLMALRHHQAMLLIDIAVPRDLDPEMAYLENVFLYNIDDLQAIAADYLRQREDEVAHCNQIIREKAASLRGLIPPVTLRSDATSGLPPRSIPSGEKA